MAYLVSNTWLTVLIPRLLHFIPLDCFREHFLMTCSRHSINHSSEWSSWSVGLTYLMIIGACICCLCTRTSSLRGACGHISLQLFHPPVTSWGMHARWSLLFFLPASLTPLGHPMWRHGCFGCAWGRCYWGGMLEAQRKTKFCIFNPGGENI